MTEVLTALAYFLRGVMKGAVLCLACYLMVRLVVLLAKEVKHKVRRPFVKVREEYIQVRGDDFDIVRMMTACAMSLENLGYDMRDARKAIANLKKMEGEDVED